MLIIIIIIVIIIVIFSDDILCYKTASVFDQQYGITIICHLAAPGSCNNYCDSQHAI